MPGVPRNRPRETQAPTFLTMLAAVFASVLVACIAAPDWAGTIEERDGVVYVTNPEQGLWNEAESPPFSFELEQVFGSDGAPIEAMLGNHYQVSFDVDDQSNVYVLDGQASRLLAFSPDGAVQWRRASRQERQPGRGERSLSRLSC